MQKIKFKNYNPKFNSELNSWHSKEHSLNRNGLTEFIVPENILLGDYIDFVNNSMIDITNLLAFDKTKLIGFLGFTQKTQNCVYIEYIGINPSCRGKGYAQQILSTFKKEILQRNPQITITFDVKKENQIGLKSFSKIAKQTKKQDKDNYIQFEL